VVAAVPERREDVGPPRDDPNLDVRVDLIGGHVGRADEQIALPAEALGNPEFAVLARHNIHGDGEIGVCILGPPRQQGATGTESAFFDDSD